MIPLCPPPLRPLRLALVAVLLLGCAVAATAGLYEKGGAIGLGARAMGLAGAYTALADDGTAAWWNPAGLSAVDTLTVDSSLGSLYDGRVQMLSFAAAYPLPAGASAGLAWVHSFYPQGTEINEDTVGLAGSLPLTLDQRLHLGGALKVLFGGVRTENAHYSALGFDLGLRYHLPLSGPGEALDLGLRTQDPDTRLQWSNGESEQVPQSTALGAAYHFDADTVSALDLEWVRSGQEEGEVTRVLRAGVERWFFDLLAVRAGYLLDDHRTSTFSAGLGFKAAGWQAEYALLGQVAELGLSHRLSVSYGLGTLRTVKPAATPTPAPTPIPPPVAFRLNLVADPTVFSPNGDGVADTTSFAVLMLEGDRERVASWSLDLETAAGKSVRSLGGSGYPGVTTWDGRDQQGRTVPDGTYRVRLHLRGARTELLASAETTLRLLTRLAQVRLGVDPAELVLIGDRPEGRLRFMSQGGEGLTGLTWQLALNDEAGRRVRTFTGTGGPLASLEWNGTGDKKRPAPAGAYQAVLTVSDEAGNRSTDTVPFRVTRLKVFVDHTLERRIFKPGDPEEGAVRMRLLVSPAARTASWALMIRDAESGRTVQVLTGTDAVPPEVLWRGDTAAGELVKGGRYFYSQLKVTFSNQQSVSGPVRALASDISVQDTDKALVLHLTGVTFEAGSSTVPLEAFKNLQQAADTIRRYAKQYRVLVKGYTDAQEAPGRELELSRDRAQRVLEFMNLSGRIPAKVLQGVGYGATNPLAPEATAAGRAKNRRVEIVLIIQR